MKYNNFPIITPAAVYEAHRGGYKFICLTEEQTEQG